MAKALYRKWRPQIWDEVIAQEHVIQTLQNAVAHDRVAHAYLFAGPRGTGKTTTARLLAKAVNCLAPELDKRPCDQCDHCKALAAGRFMDLIEIDAASNTSVDDVRDLREKINFSPSQGKFKVYIIDEVHMLSTAAFNALLKTLEEPPPHAIFILATTEIHKIPATVLSRCQQHEFRRIPIKDIVSHLKEKSQSEDIHIEEPVFTVIARQATGSLRDAISLLDQLTATDETITLEMAQNVLGTATSLSVIEITDALIKRNTAAGLAHINKALDAGTDPRQLARQLVTYLRNVLLVKMNNQEQIEEAENIREKIYEHASQINIPELLQAIEAFNQATSNEHASWHPGLGLELAFTSFLEGPLAGKVVHRPTEEPPIKQPQTARNSAVPPIKQDPPAALVQEDTEEATQDPPKRKPKKSSPKPKDPKAEEPQKKDAAQAAEEITEPEQIPQPAGSISLTDIQRAWPKVKATVGNHNRKTEGLLNSSRLAGLKENALILGFSSEILKDMMEKEGNLNLTQDILEEVLSQPLMIKCVVTSSQAGALPENLEIDKDGMVSTATRDLGGKISRAEDVEKNSKK